MDVVASTSRTHLNQIRSFRETKSNHSKIMEAHKSIWFQLNVRTAACERVIVRNLERRTCCAWKISVIRC